MNILSKKERFHSFNTLNCLVQALQGRITTIDLRNENSVTGEIISVDGYMNIILKDVVFRDSINVQFPFETFFVQSKNIRYVHIPDDVKIVPAIKQQLDSITRKKIVPLDNRKNRRARERHQETMNEVRMKMEQKKK